MSEKEKTGPANTKKELNLQEIGEMLKEIRVKKNVRQLDIANAIGMEESFVTRLEKGSIQSISECKVKAIAKAYGISEKILRPFAKLRLSQNQGEKPYNIMPVINILAENNPEWLSMRHLEDLVNALKLIRFKVSKETVLGLLADIKASKHKRK